MDPKKFLEAKEMEIDGMKFVISKIPAIKAQQIYRSIMQETKDEGDLGMTYLSSQTTIDLLSYTATAEGEEWDALDTEDKINFCCKGIMTMIKLEAAMIRYNYSFLFDGSLLKVLDVLRDSQQDT